MQVIRRLKTWNTKLRHTHNHLGHEWISMILDSQLLFFFFSFSHSSVDTAMIVKQLNAWTVYIRSIWICWNRMLKTLICTHKHTKKRVFLVSFCEWRLARVRQYNNNNIHAYPQQTARDHHSLLILDIFHANLRAVDGNEVFSSVACHCCCCYSGSGMKNAERKNMWSWKKKANELIKKNVFGNGKSNNSCSLFWCCSIDPGKFLRIQWHE